MINKNLRILKRYCNNLSLIENYNLAVNDESQTWDLHHRLEIQNNKSVSRQDLINQNLYYHRPHSELIFLPHSVHISLHNHYYIKSEETCQKISKSNKGKKLSQDHKQKISNSLKNKPKSSIHKQNISLGHIGVKHSDETKQKLSISHSNKKFSASHRKNLSISCQNRPCPTKGKHRVYDNQEHTKFHFE